LIISSTFLFDKNHLGYVDFLEALVRIAVDYPFSEKEMEEMASLKMKIMFIVSKLEDRFKNLKSVFKSK